MKIFIGNLNYKICQ